jgi:sialic acid synthase SpsE
MTASRIHVGNDRLVGPGEPALVVAEIGQNHNGSLALAEQLVDVAAWAGADAVKLVKRDLASELSSDAARKPYLSPHSFGLTYGEHRRALELSADDHAALACRAREHGLLYFCTACDLPSAQLLDSLGVDVFKIASRDLANLPLLECVARLGRPIFLSTGMSQFDEIDAAVRTLSQHNDNWLLMHCTSLYPTPFSEVNLRSMPALAARYGSLVGFSDHTPGVLMPPVAVALGAVVIEKHLTLDRQLKGTDHACSLEPEELSRMIAEIRQVESALGRADKPIPHGVSAVRTKLGRSLVTRINLSAGTPLEESMLVLKCPGDGLSWSERDLVLGRQLKRDVAANEKLSIEDFS